MYLNASVFQNNFWENVEITFATNQLPGKQTGASIELAGLALCNFQNASVNMVTKCLSLASDTDQLAVTSFSSSKSVTSNTANITGNIQQQQEYIITLESRDVKIQTNQCH